PSSASDGLGEARTASRGSDAKGGPSVENRTLRTGSPSDAGMDPERIERVRRLCAGWVEQEITQALQVAVVRRGVTVLQGAWGRLGPETEARPLTNDSIFGIASTT